MIDCGSVQYFPIMYCLIAGKTCCRIYDHQHNDRRFSPMSYPSMGCTLELLAGTKQIDRPMERIKGQYPYQVEHLGKTLRWAV
jgi:hypothetical protein